jgi:hypothetical protein
MRLMLSWGRRALIAISGKRGGGLGGRMGGVVEQGYGLNHMGGVAEMAACTGKQTETLHLQKRKLYDQMFRNDRWSEWVQCTIFMSLLTTIGPCPPSTSVLLRRRTQSFRRPDFTRVHLSEVRIFGGRARAFAGEEEKEKRSMLWLSRLSN